MVNHILTIRKEMLNKTVVINDPLGQTHKPASSDPYSQMKIVLKSEDGRTDRRTCLFTCGKIVVTAARDCESAEWIKKVDISKNCLKSSMI